MTKYISWLWDNKIVAGILVVLGYIFYLRFKNAKLETELSKSKVDTQIADTLARKDVAEKESEDADKKYNDLLDAYKRERDKG